MISNIIIYNNNYLIADAVVDLTGLPQGKVREIQGYFVIGQGNLEF